MRTLLSVLLTTFCVPAFAGSSLGVTGAAFSLGMAGDEGGVLRGEERASLDVAITGVHGFQGDLSFSDTMTGGIGTAAAHLYMAPAHGRKYGLFAALSDIDGRSMMYGSVGAEGMFSMGEATTLEVQGGVGWSDTNGLDYVFAGGAVAHGLTPALELELSLDLADFDEAGFSATAWDVGLTASYSPEGAPWGAYASVTQSGLSGADSTPGETRFGLGVTLNLGASGGTDPRTRHFRTVDPVAPLVRRGIW